MADPRLVRAKARLDRLDWWPRPVRIAHVRILVAPNAGKDRAKVGEKLKTP